ncbi:MAG: serine/threonine protein kinase [Propionibacteriaceae bacterium]|jgi:serine/threonine protein kinase|nr:serine/threonine protein kinase [Propionibacteriaceae bacterium]
MTLTAETEAPRIPGLTFKGFLGAGGFADVYLYESASPLRDVAVKVLHPQVMSDQQVMQFTNEANTMASLEHPYIVRVYSSGVTADGRPYIEMAYYPEPNLADAVEASPLAVADVVKIGVQLASAVESAHRVGLLHRDIKPANILIDRFGDPALTDFGVSSHIHHDDDLEIAVSVPWAPPEAIFATQAPDRRSDIYSLAATMWHLLVGHSPFNLPDGDNRVEAMMVRVRDEPLRATGCRDVPASLERLLRQAMSKDPALRPSSCEGFALELNAIEEELGLNPTQFKVARNAELSPAVEPGLNSHPTVVRRVSPDPALAKIPTPLAALEDEADIGEVTLTRKSFRTRLVVGLLIALAIVGGIVGWVRFGPDRPVVDPTELATPQAPPHDDDPLPTATAS